MYYVTGLRYFIKQSTSLGYFYGSQRVPFFKLWVSQENLSWYSVLNIYHKITIAIKC